MHLWRFPVADVREDDQSLLSESELSRAARYLVPEARRRFIARRSQLRRTLARYLSVDPASLNLLFSDTGKPTLVASEGADPPLRFNVSSSGDWLLVSLSAAFEVGVDIERGVAGHDFAAIEHLAMSEAERRYLAGMTGAARLRAFYRTWTMKEAVVKALGKGLTYPLASVPIPTGGSVPDVSLTLGSGESFSLTSFEPVPGYFGAIAVQGPRLNARFFSTS